MGEIGAIGRFGFDSRGLREGQVTHERIINPLENEQTLKGHFAGDRLVTWGSNTVKITRKLSLTMSHTVSKIHNAVT